MIHKEASELAGKTVRIKSSVKHFQYPDFGGSDFTVEDYWDRIANKSWMDCDGNPACLVYALRSGFSNIPLDNEVLYGKSKNGLGSLVHVSEIEQ
jgi:hypothetical protein